MQTNLKAGSGRNQLFMRVLTLWGLLVLALSAGAQPAKAEPATAYMLLHGSSLTDDCPICDRVIIAQPMRGKFELRLLEKNSLFSRYAVENILFTAGSATGPAYKVTGRGEYRVGGEVALVQQMFLELQIDDGISNRIARLTNDVPAVERSWPMLKIHLDQTNGTLSQVYRLEIAAAPVVEIWFSPQSAFHSGTTGSDVISGGDLISSAGRIVKRNQELTAGFGFMPVAPDMGLDALNILPGNDIVFSMEQNGFSETMGPLNHGDLLFARSRQVVRNEDLLTPITGGQRPPYDLGLDAVHVPVDGQIYFSVRSNLVIFNDPQPNIVIRPGDLLFSDLVLGQGSIVKHNDELLGRFHPMAPIKDWGLDAIYIWPGGEIWFSTETGFQDEQLGPIGPGDLLSDRGYVVFTNRELLAPFAPVETVGDFGLDGLFIITDVATADAAARFTTFRRGPADNVVELRWDGGGRVYQVQRARYVTGPFSAISDILSDLSFTDTNALSSEAFYRFRQW